MLLIMYCLLGSSLTSEICLLRCRRKLINNIAISFRRCLKITILSKLALVESSILQLIAFLRFEIIVNFSIVNNFEVFTFLPAIKEIIILRSKLLFLQLILHLVLLVLLLNYTIWVAVELDWHIISLPIARSQLYQLPLIRFELQLLCFRICC